MIESNTYEHSSSAPSATPSPHKHEVHTAPSAVADRVQQARSTLRSHPYLATGLVAGAGLALAGGFFLLMQRRRSFFDIAMDWF